MLFCIQNDRPQCRAANTPVRRFMQRISWRWGVAIGGCVTVHSMRPSALHGGGGHAKATHERTMGRWKAFIQWGGPRHSHMVMGTQHSHTVQAHSTAMQHSHATQPHGAATQQYSHTAQPHGTPTRRSHAARPRGRTQPHTATGRGRATRGAAGGEGVLGAVVPVRRAAFVADDAEGVLGPAEPQRPGADAHDAVQGEGRAGLHLEELRGGPAAWARRQGGGWGLNGSLAGVPPRRNGGKHFQTPGMLVVLSGCTGVCLDLWGFVGICCWRCLNSTVGTERVCVGEETRTT